MHYLAQRKLAHLASVAMLCLVSGASHANLLTNGDFESGDLTGWSLTGVNCCTGIYPSGNYFWNGNINSVNATLSQTILDTAGASYRLEFDFKTAIYYNYNYDAAFFGVNLNGNPLLSIVNPNTSDQWVDYSINFTGTGNDTIDFVGYHNPSWWFLDNVSVTNVPEPTTLALLGFGLVGLGFSRRRKC